MAHRPKVPTALHSELTEYSSLLRALRTSNTLDLAQHLAEPAPTRSLASSDVDDVSLPDEDLDDAVDDPPLTESASRDLTSDVGSSTRSRTSSQPRARLATGKAKQRDTWTRWPLLAGDVHVPEWGLHDEVRHATEEGLVAIRNRRAESPPLETRARSIDHSPRPPDEDEDEHPALSSAALRAMTAESAAFLTRILALLAAHVPNTEKSMQNRLRPINWQTVIDVACAHRVVSPGTAERVRERMARLYPPAQPSIAPRVDRLSATKANLTARLAELDATLLMPSEFEVKRKTRRGPQKREASPDPGTSVKRQRSEGG